MRRLLILACIVGAGCATGAASTTPGAPSEAPKTIAAHRAQCPDGSSLKQSRHHNERLKLLVCMDSEGRQHGAARMFREDGSLELTANYRHGRMHGPMVEWHPNGRAFLTGSYSDGLEDGRWEAFTADGRPIGSFEMAQGSGLRQRWHRNGTPQQRVRLVRGLPAGEAVEWHPNGAVAMRVTFVAGKPHGVLQRFHTNGSKSEAASYVSGALDGEQVQWSNAGGKVAIKRWRAGQLHGKSLLYTRAGVFKTAACFVGDRLMWDVDAIRWVGSGSSSAPHPKSEQLEAAAKARPCRAP